MLQNYKNRRLFSKNLGRGGNYLPTLGRRVTKNGAGRRRLIQNPSALAFIHKGEVISQ